MQLHLERQLLDHCPHSENQLEQMLRDLIQEAEKWDLAPKSASFWWTSTHDSRESLVFQLKPRQDVIDSLLKRHSRFSDVL